MAPTFDETTAEGAFETIASLAAIEDLEAAIEAYRAAMRRAYWDDKDTHIVVAVAYAGVSRFLAEASRPEVDEDLEYELRSAAKGLTYDLASFTWVGWDEPGIELSPAEMSAGLAAARTNLSLAYSLQKGDLPISRAHWMLGAHQLTAGDHENASVAFDEGRRYADAADAADEASLCAAFAVLAARSAGSATDADLDQAIEDLMVHEGGDDLATQVTTARSVIGT